VVLSCTLSNRARAELADDGATAAEASEPREQEDEFEQNVSAALAAFQAKQFEQALVDFERAIALGNDPSELSTLYFDAGVCAFELGHYDDAERRFDRAASFGTGEADTARVHAGFSALRSGALDRAERHLAELSAEGHALPLALQLEKDIASERKRRRRDRAVRELHAGFDALAQNDYAAAERHLELAHQGSVELTMEERGDVEYGLARVADKHGNTTQALAHVRAALVALPDACELYRYQGRLFERSGDVDRAVHSHRRALACAETRDEADLAQRAIDRLHPLGKSGWRGSAELSAGYDTNAAQSGTARGLDTATRPGAVFDTGSASPVIPSAALELNGRLGYDHRLAFDWALLPRFATSNLLLLNEPVRASSLSVQELALGIGHTPNMSTRTELYVGVAALQSDVPPLTALSREAFVGAEAELRPARDFALWTEARFTGVQGAAAAPSLTGFRVEAEIGARHFTERWSITSRAQLTWNSLGFTSWTTGGERFACAFGGGRFGAGGGCDELFFTVPASYLAPRVGFDLGYWPGDWLRLSGSAAAEYRHYLAPARVFRLPFDVEVSKKTRQDLLLEPAIEARVYPWTRLDLYGFVRESMRFNVSNMRPDALDPNHRFDYEDRNYSQYVSMVGIGAAF
jgi:tetratricopeptide (TPR) repeat protein